MKKLNVTVIFTIEVADDVDPATVITNVAHVEFVGMDSGSVAEDFLAYETVCVEPVDWTNIFQK